MRFFFICLGLCSCSFAVAAQPSRQMDIPAFIAHLTHDERVSLEYFFRSLIQENSVGYVLLGGKPLGFHSYILPKLKAELSILSAIDKLELFFEAFARDNILFHKGFKTWKKYEKQLCGNNIVFDLFEETQDLHLAKVIVINKRLLLPVMEQYLNDFKTLDPSLKSAASTLNTFVYDQEFKSKFYNQDYLLGILLGYGAKNAALFQKRAGILNSLHQLQFTLHVPSLDHTKDLQTQYAAIQQSFTGFRDHSSRKFLFTLGVGFQAIPSDPETISLHKKYTHLHKQLTQAYQNSTFLEKTLELIASEDKRTIDCLVSTSIPQRVQVVLSEISARAQDNKRI